MAARAKKERQSKHAATPTFHLSDVVKSRIVDHVVLKPSDIQDHPLQGAWAHTNEQARALAGALKQVGIVDELTVYRSERAGGAWVTPDGHLRKSLDPDLPWPCTVLDITDTEADFILATKDPIAALKQANADGLLELLGQVQAEDAAVQELLRDLQASVTVEPAKDTGDEEGEQTITPELFERSDYLVFVFDNQFDWQVACEALGVGKAWNAEVAGRTIAKRGIGRVLKARQLLELLDK